jgi:trk system potassium uptake protein TrkH
LWSPVLKGMLFFLMFMGGCAGSTAGGLKVFRVAVVFKACLNEIYRAFRPESMRALVIGRAVVKPEIVHTIVVFFAIFALIFVAVTLFVASFGHDLVTSASSTIACLASIGPGLGMVNSASNYAFYEPPVKIVLSMCMILGRLELFTVLVLLVPSFWRR